jgi:putative DNA primase/helicase
VTERTNDPLPPIRFEALNDALLARIETLVPAWLPGGAMKGTEYFVHSFWRSEKTPSLSVCMRGARVGKWQDHGGEHKGGDLISLYAAIHGLTNGAAAVQLARELGLESVAGVLPAQGGARPATPAPAAASVAPRVKIKEPWTTVAPVPDMYPRPTFKHEHRSLDDIEHLATYRVDGALYGYVVRFRTSDGGKESIPHTWCQNAANGTLAWKWRTWVEPRPLYLPGGVSPAAAKEAQRVATVVVVEGEKKAEVLQKLLDEHAPGVYLVASWPGGCKVWDKAHWEWLAGTDVLLWPDCDGKREKLSAAEAAQCVDEAARDIAQAMKPLLPAHKQVGMKAMLGIGALLQGTHGCKVQILPIPQPLEVSDGWDCADAILTDGWDATRVLEFFGRAQPLPDASAAPSKGAVATSAASGGGKNADRPGGPGASEDDFDGDGDPFQAYLDWLCTELKCKVHDLGVNRKMVVKALRTAPALRRCLGLNMLTGAPSTQVPWPWRDQAGPLEESDALRLGDWLSTTYKLKAASKAALEEAIVTVADERRFHPIRDWLQGLQWDGTPRRHKWLIHILGKGPAKDQEGPTELDTNPKLKRYYELMGSFLLMGLVARVMKPGCKFDYSPVFEGLPGRGKSTLVKTLVGTEFFSDTHFDVGNGKDGMEQLEGLWGYELSELTALRKADSEQVKQFFSSTIDRFRGAYGKYVQAHPRQCVIFCSTNKKQYLYDLTGNRRFWPIWIEHYIKLDWLKKWREQLFAEAYAMYIAGEPYTPTPDEEMEYFEPEQKKRLVETAVQSRLYELLTREGAASTEGKLSSELNINVTFVTLDRLVAALGTDAAKSSSPLEAQIRGWLESHGWTYGREGGGLRRRGYKQPKQWPPEFADEEDDGAPPGGAPAEPIGSPAPGSDHKDDDHEPF